MTERICEHCGQRFLSITVWNKLENVSWFLVALIFPFNAVDYFKEGWRGLLPGLGLLVLAGGAIYALYLNRKKNEGEVVKFGRKCPSCGDRTAHVDSPLGEQLIEYWSSPQTEDRRDIVEEPLTIAGEGEEANIVVAHNGSPGE